MHHTTNGARYQRMGKWQNTIATAVTTTNKQGNNEMHTSPRQKKDQHHSSPKLKWKWWRRG
jgi:hypothetical protein